MLCTPAPLHTEPQGIPHDHLRVGEHDGPPVWAVWRLPLPAGHGLVEQGGWIHAYSEWSVSQPQFDFFATITVVFFFLFFSQSWSVQSFWLGCRSCVQLRVLPVPWLPWPPVHLGVWLPRRRVQVLPRVWLPRPDSPDPVHQENPALRGSMSSSKSSWHPFFPSPCLHLSSLSFPPSPPNHHLQGSTGPASLNWITSWSSGVHWCLLLTALFFLKKHHQNGKIYER